MVNVFFLEIFSASNWIFMEKFAGLQVAPWLRHKFVPQMLHHYSVDFLKTQTLFQALFYNW